MFPFLNSNKSPFQNIPSYLDRLQNSNFTVEELLDEDDIFQFVKNGSDDPIKAL